MSRLQGNDARLEKAIRANTEDLLRYLRRRLASPEDGADVLSESLAIAWRKRAALPKDDGCRPWLFTVARNTLLNARRSSRRRTAATNALRTHLDIIQQMTGVPSEEALDVRAAVARLPKDQRELVELVHWDGLTIAEAAAVVGIPASTARSRYASARTLLRVELGITQPVPTP